MKFTKPLFRVLPALLGTWLLWAGVAGAIETISVQDLARRTVKVPLGPRRIICLSPGTLRLACYLGAQQAVVGVEEFEKNGASGRPYRLANPELVKLPTVGPGGPKSINGMPDLEAVLKVKPDVIFVSYMKAATADVLQSKLGIPTVVVSYGRFGAFDPAVYKSIRIMGKILKSDERAEEIVSFVESCREDLSKRTSGLARSDRPSVYVGAIGYKGFQGIESTDTGYPPLQWANGKNIAHTGRSGEHLFIDKEQLLAWNPDIVFIDGGGLKLVRDDTSRKPEYYLGLKAFREKRVHLLFPFNMYMTNLGTALADGYAIGKVLYPESFRDVVLRRKTDEIYRYLLGKPVYGQMEKDFGPLGARLDFDALEKDRR